MQTDLFRHWMASEDKAVSLPLTLFDFRDPNDVADARMISINKSNDDSWRMSDDEVIGGYSRATFRVIQTMDDLTQLENGNSNNETEPSKQSQPKLQNDQEGTTTMENKPNEKDESDFIPFVRWMGRIDTRIGVNSNAIRSGFCSIKSPLFPFGVANLAGKYNALEFKLRSDGRQYNINLYGTSVIPSTYHQAVLEEEVPSSPTSDNFSTVVLPFRQFRNVFQGRVQENPIELDDGINLENIGITLMDGRDGEFKLDLASIRAVNYYDDSVMEE